MQGNDWEQSHQELWKSQDEGPMQMTSEEVRAKASRYERESVLVYRVALGLTPLFLTAFIHNLVRLHAPLLIAGTGLALATYCCMVWKLVRNGPNRIAPAEPCLEFLRREFEAKRRGLLWIRGCLLLLIPAVLLSWWGGGPALRAKTLGVQSPWLLSLLKGPAPLIVMALIIAFLWLAFTSQARKIKREINKLPEQ